MFDERALIARLEAANTDELIQLFLHASSQEEAVLRVYLGDSRYRRMRNLVLRREMTISESGDDTKGNIVIIPGILGSELTSKDRHGTEERIWLSPRRIVAGHMERLRLDEHGLKESNSDYTIQATGIMKRYYGELMLSLSENWRVQAFWYDWRKDFRLAAAELQASIDSWFPADKPVHIIACGEGGLVARSYIAGNAKRWDDCRECRLVMLGTPNYGTFTAPQAITGHLEAIRRMDMLDKRHDRADFRDIVRSFPSLYQLLPTPNAPGTKEMHRLYEAKTYSPDLQVPQLHLNMAMSFHEGLNSGKIDRERMIYVAGHNQPTVVLRDGDIDQIASYRGEAFTLENEREYLRRTYQITNNGDGKLPHRLGVLGNPKKPIPTFYLDAPGSTLTVHTQVMMALDELLSAAESGISANDPDFHKQLTLTSGLRPMTPDMLRSGSQPIAKPRKGEEALLGDKAATDSAEMDSLVRRISIRSGESVDRAYFTIEERSLEESLTRGFVGADPITRQTRGLRLSEPTSPKESEKDFPTPEIEISIVHGDITQHDLSQYNSSEEQPKPDAIAVGHYSGSKPYGLTDVLDREISQWNLAGVDSTTIDETDLLITQFVQRGTIRGELAESFFLNDPREIERTIAIAGMGEPGRFGVPELTILVRELCWTLGRMGKKHLSASLIGTGKNNLSVADSIKGWVRGIKLAISGISNNPDEEHKGVLTHITFIIEDPQKLLECDEAIRKEQQVLLARNRMTINYEPLKQSRQREIHNEAVQYVTEQMNEELRQKLNGLGRNGSSDINEQTPTRITVGLQGNTYKFGAITTGASIPEREIPLDPELVRRANDELSAEGNPRRQLELGEFMERLLFPEDLRSQLSSTSPLIMMLDNATAGIHWEMLAQSDLAAPMKAEKRQSADEPHFNFLGTSRGFTRQLRTVNSLPPDPPPPGQRRLRVLVVADPAADAHLPGAEEEGIAVADLFERFNMVHGGTGNSIDVVRLFGPHEAKRTTVLRHLMMRTYDVLHFAGHCVYDKENPTQSGWIFSDGQRLSAYEMSRIDRSPSLVFSNACESGVTTERSGTRSVELAPSFAESFFARGVSNFVCTAWPVEDRSARVFALSLYAHLLGLAPQNANPGRGGFTPSEYHAATPLPIYQAMQKARQIIAIPPNDTRTWGAYQHYGNPYFRLFEPKSMLANELTNEAQVQPGADPNEAGKEQKLSNLNGHAPTPPRSDASAEPKSAHDES